MLNPMIHLTDRFIQGLSCAAISPGLQSILVFDISPSMLHAGAALLSQMLQAITGQSVLFTRLGPGGTDDDLWGSPTIRDNLGELTLGWQRGLVAEGRTDAGIQIVLIPDITRLSLAAARACITLMGADVAHLERHGRHEHWQPDIYWLAGCASDQVGHVSPHVLDRFALRLSGAHVHSFDRASEILAWLADPALESNLNAVPLSPEISHRLQQAVRRLPIITDAAIERVQSYISLSRSYSPRRDLALGRLARAHAQLAGSHKVTAEDVDAAARLIALESQEQQVPQAVQPAVASAQQPPEVASQPSLFDLAAQEPANPVTHSEPIFAPDAGVEFSSAFLPPQPYPEDQVPTAYESESLRLPVRRYGAVSAVHGPAIGVEQAHSLQDLAIASTLLEAAKFQSLRKKQSNIIHDRLVVLPSDLRSYRRAPIAEQMLVLLLDYTCLHTCAWQPAVLPYLTWAYVERARICVVQVGAADAHDMLRAERVMAQSILVPRISTALEVGAGKATPLAHGLDLALQTLRKELQHGRSAVHHAVLVVVSDGRGNVPLDGNITQPIGRKGIDDALQVAHRISALNHVETVLLNPQPKQYPDVPLNLADALGATVVSVAPLEAAEVP